MAAPSPVKPGHDDFMLLLDRKTAVNGDAGGLHQNGSTKTTPVFANIPNVAGCNGQIVLQRGRDELATLDRYRRMKRHDASPSIGALLIEWKNPRAVAQPSVVNHASRRAASRGLVMRLFLMPFLISPSVMTLKKQIG
jgi:hypothetical protein